ncbi:hypothetical protein [Paraburkholderia sp. GAS334]|uniref:hypothetical protein n=1 Tax=Paraburkholderia sp. GAS334 TaxID=3035131 RepID=UPI003D1F563C
MRRIHTPLTQVLDDLACTNSPQAIRWFIKATIFLTNVVPFAFLVVPWFASVWAIGELQLAAEHVLGGAVYAFMELLKLGMSAFAFEVLMLMFIIRDEWIPIAHQNVYDGIEDLLQPWLR